MWFWLWTILALCYAALAALEKLVGLPAQDSIVLFMLCLILARLEEFR